jgi:hypothetical protein
MSTESVSSDSSLQAAQLIQDQLSEEELEMVAGGVLNELSRSNKPKHAPGGIPRIPSSNGAFPSSPVGIEDIPDIYDTFTS